ncbi:uncharacterized protein LOC130569212 isoform X2 [Triplophysa rosa]|nr:uncharacterized protein LOC130569212 isoform X2 [Triplophysa rosa]
MKKSTPEERAPEVQKARASNRDWIRSNRTWDYKQLCELLSDRRSRITMVKELLRRGFFIKNQPQESDVTLDPDDNSATTAPATTTMTTTAAAARSATSSTREADYSSSSCVSDEEDGRTKSSSVWMKMKGAGLHQKFPSQAKLLVDFKKYLTEALRVPHWQQQVDNVSRFLRYMQPTGDEPTLDFLSKSTETEEFVKTLQHTKMNAATILKYFKSIYKFLEYLLTRVDLQRADSQLQSSCKNYRQLLNTLRKTVYSNKTCDTRHRQDVDGVPSITDCQRILRVAEPDFLRINGNLQNGLALSNTEKTMYRYYCEALLVFCHMQRPQAVENLTDAEWVKRIQHGGRVVTGTSSMQIALTLDEEAWFQMYYKQIRPDSIRHGKFSRGFFLSSSGEAVHSVSQDMNHFHELYKLSTSKSQDVRRAVETAAKNLTADQQKAIRIYLACGTADSKMLQPHKIVDTAVLLDSLSGKSEETSAAATSDVIMGQHTFQKDFSAFVARFPVSLEGQPPCKKQRVDSGYPEDATFYLKWRASQYAKRLEYLM